MWQHIFFDLDGTLTDPKVGITNAVSYALEKFGIHVRDRDDLIPFIGPPLTDSFRKYYDLSEDDAEKAVGYFREYFAPKGIFENDLIEGIPELLEHLTAAGRNVYLATSKPTFFAEQILDHFNIRQYFRFVSGSEFDGTRVHKDEVIAYLLDHFDIACLDAVIVGDRHHDIDGAKVCGIASVGVRFGYAAEGELEAAGADRIAATVEELERILLN